MPWNKPYHPPRNQRLDPELYTHANRVYFMTIRAYLHQSPFVRDDLNQLILDTLRQEQERPMPSVLPPMLSYPHSLPPLCPKSANFCKPMLLASRLIWMIPR
jgi:hypothetical protein